MAATEATDELPVAEPAEDDSKADAKEEEPADDDKKEKEMPMFPRIPKEHPGEHYKDQFPDKIDVRGEPDEILFKWNPDFREKRDCDTIHTLYLLQLACEGHRKRTIERNNYFESISRSDRYISHVDTPQIITNFLKWHNEDKDNNLFTGKMLETEKKLFMINQMISEVGGTKKGPATRIFTKLRKEVMIEHDQWTQQGAGSKLKLFTWGLKKLYSGEVVLEECSVDDVVTLFTFEAEDEAKDDDAKEVPVEELVDGIFSQFEKTSDKGAGKKLMAVDGWKEKIVAWIRSEALDGQKMKEMATKKLAPGMKNAIIPDDVMNDAGKQANKQLGGPCNKMLNRLKKMPVHKVLEAAKAKAAATK